MQESNAFTRREFIHTGLAVVSTVTTIPTFLQHSAQALAADAAHSLTRSRPGVPEERIVVVVQLSGGNDGLNTVVPYGMREYYDARPRLSVADTDVLRVDATQGIGLHPELADFKELLDEGLAAVVQGVGYPNPNRSHFASMDIWHSGDTRNSGTGWIGRSMDQLRQRRGENEPTACVCVGREAPLATQGKLVKPVSFENAAQFRWVGTELHDALAPVYDKINRAGVIEGVDQLPGDQAAFVMRTALDAQIGSDQIRQAVARGSVTSFPGGNQLASQLKMVSAMIRANLPTRVYYVALGGFDTHANQSFAHGRNLRTLGSALKAFYRELDAIGQRQRVLTMCFSEFGRRVAQNASNGTDHGTAGPMFLVGDMVRPGLIGTHPSLTGLDGGDLIYHTDFRSVYAAVLDDWLKLDSKQVLAQSFKPAAVFDPRKVG